MRENKRRFWLGSYDRPTAKYRCGEQCAPPCSMGPTENGGCQGGTECVPRQEQDRWHCARAGKPCEEGPSPSGQCCHQIVCIPERNYRSSRKTSLILFSALMLAALVLLFNFGVDNTFFSPGPLSPAHAVKGNDDCRQCHLLDHADIALGSALINSLPTTTCTTCHDFEGNETLAHNQFQTSGLAGGALACGSCHQLHEGLDVLHSGSQQCSTCHEKHVDDLVSAHAQKFKVGSQQGLKFDHAKHFSKYIPKDQRRGLACLSCHTDDKGVKRDLELNVCRDCHEQDIGVENNVAEFIAIPLLDTETLSAKGIGIGQWPADMDEPYLSNMTLAYLSQRSELRPLVSKLRSDDLDLSDLSEVSDDELRQVQSLLFAFKEYLYLLSSHPTRVIGEIDFQDDTFEQEKLAGLVSLLFPNLEQELISIRSGQPLANLQLSSLEVTQDAKSNWSLEGNKIMARAKEHKDEFVLSWLEVLESSSSKGRIVPELQDSAKAQLFSEEEGLCLKCHQLSSKHLPKFSTQEVHSYLGFSHDVHENLVDGSCETCHGTVDSFKTNLESDMCFSCHLKDEQLSECSSCHNYHAID